MKQRQNVTYVQLHTMPPIIKKMIEDKGYTFIGNDEVEVGSTTHRHMYYYTK